MADVFYYKSITDASIKNGYSILTEVYSKYIFCACCAKYDREEKKMMNYVSIGKQLCATLKKTNLCSYYSDFGI